MMIGVNTYTMGFAGDVEAGVAKAAEMGFEAIEFQPEGLGLSGEVGSVEADAAKARGIFAKYRLAPSAMACDADFVQTDRERFDHWVRWGEYCAALSAELGLKVVKYFAGEPKPGLSDDQVVDCMVRGSIQLARTGEKYGVAFAQENHGRFTNRPEVQLRILRAAESPKLGLCIDSSNYRWFGHPLKEVYRIFREMAPYALHIHVKDGDGTSGAEGSYKATALGEGELDIRFLLTEVAKHDYSGDLVLEYEGTEGEAGVRRSLACLKRLAKEIFGI